MKNAKFVLATANPGKLQEMREILSGLGLEVVSRDDVGIDFEVEETGANFMENALIKAQAICKASGLPAIADDSGLVIDALGGEPGVNTSSFGGEHLTARERNEFLLKIMENMEQRSASFVCTIVCVFPDGGTISAQGDCRGEILRAPRGSGGFGYDPVFIADGMDKSMAELPAEEKNALSHRGKALRKMADLLQSKIMNSEF